MLLKLLLFSFQSAFKLCLLDFKVFNPPSQPHAFVKSVFELPVCICQLNVPIVSLLKQSQVSFLFSHVLKFKSVCLCSLLNLLRPEDFHLVSLLAQMLCDVFHVALLGAQVCPQLVDPILIRIDDLLKMIQRGLSAVVLRGDILEDPAHYRQSCLQLNVALFL